MLKNAVVDRTVSLRESEEMTLDQKQNSCTSSTSCSSVGSQPAMHLHLSDVREEAQELVADSVDAASRPSHVLSIFICCLFINVCLFP